MPRQRCLSSRGRILIGRTETEEAYPYPTDCPPARAEQSTATGGVAMGGLDGDEVGLNRERGLLAGEALLSIDGQDYLGEHVLNLNLK
jgi:hypothetical protein